MKDSRNIPLMGDLNTVVCMDEVNSCIFGKSQFYYIFYILFIYGES
jgi:hypothetical protein